MDIDSIKTRTLHIKNQLLMQMTCHLRLGVVSHKANGPVDLCGEQRPKGGWGSSESAADFYDV